MNKRRFLLSFILSATMTLNLGGCGMFNPLSDYDENTVMLKKSGEVRELIVESFSDSNYSKDALISFVDNQVESYNTKVGSDDAVSLERKKIKNGTARMELAYDAVSDFSDFNGITFDVSEAEKYSDDEHALSYVDAEGNPVSLSDINMKKYNVVITDRSMNIVTPGKVAYFSDNVTLVDKKCVKTTDSLSVAFYKD